MKNFVLLIIAAITICGATMFTSCSPVDNPATQQEEETLKAKLVGQWIIEMTADEVKTAGVVKDVTLPAEGDTFVYICQFDTDGTGWQEFNILKDGDLVGQSFTRYDSEFSYMMSADGKVAVKFEDNDKQALAFSFDGKTLKHTDGDKVTILVSATTEQIQTYQMLSDEWHGGSAGSIDLSTLEYDYVAQDGDILTGTLDDNVQISIADGATVTLNHVNINGSGAWIHDQWAGITCKGNATIILKGTNIVKGFYENFPGIFVPGDKDNPTNNKTLTIQGTGSLTASSNGWATGIGGGRFISCGNIVIESGSIIAFGGDDSAGIGGGAEKSCGTITISGGSVNATGGIGAAGIGSGEYGSCGTITISGGTVNANGGKYAAGIGGGYGAGCGDITITTGVTSVIATKSASNPGPNSIGAGCSDSDFTATCGTVTIGGIVTGNITDSPYTYPQP